ncbi:uncharacterized protein LOC118443509 [Vespa mandarinia]|uniref:uncharacterized protein LOC118443509 n=1 Tax=Vespa mandarinia TaxID=7446 RepID=UPI00161DC1F7|nr:uncharacterized protein LOC118443509 [Vespa mandarinia]
MTNGRTRLLVRKRVHLWKASPSISRVLIRERPYCAMNGQGQEHEQSSHVNNLIIYHPTDDRVYREIVRLDDALWDRRLFSCLSENETNMAIFLLSMDINGKLDLFLWHVGLY